MVEAGGAAAVQIDGVASLNTAVASPRVCRSAVHVAPSQRNSTSADPYTKTGAGPLVIRFSTGFEDHRILKIESVPPGIRRAPRPAMWAAPLPAQTWFVCF